MNNYNTNIYLDIEAIRNWKERIKNINQQSIDKLEEIDAKINTINDFMEGNIAEGFKKDIKNLTSNGILVHNNMKDLEKMINNIVEIRKKQ